MTDDEAETARLQRRSVDELESIEERLRRLAVLAEEGLDLQRKQAEELKTQNLIACLSLESLGAEGRSALEHDIRRRLGL
ncbi:hypothetical protein [Brevibacterium oceani]|uniref:hypothetical protein n=1 Tax=Brevibacterium oceani TaxID=358099 RepID=UPI0015E78AFC|nr:hypothetical protein [Brevibacterium oceani]